MVNEDGKNMTTVDRPQWLSSRVSQNELSDLEEAVRKAELNTSGEIVPLIVRRSSTIGHIPLTLILLLTSVWLIGDRLLYFYTGISSFDSPLLTLGPTLFILCLTVILSQREWIQRILTPRNDQALQVNQRAEIEFFTSNIKKTMESTGVLIMLSLMERRAVVLADKAIKEKLPPETWDHVIKEIILGVKNKNIAEGMITGVRICGDLLSPHFPIRPDDVNELPNHLIIKE